MQRIKKRDNVVVIAGRNKGAQGEVVDIDHANQRVRIKGVALVKKHARARRKGEVAKIRTQESYIDLSNVMLIGPDGKPTRVRYQGEPGKKVRVSAKTGVVID